VQPGATEKVEATVVFGGAPGPSKRLINVQTNDRAKLNLALECNATVKTAIRTEPPTVFINNVKRDAESVVQTVKLKRGDGGPLAPKILAEGGRQFTATLTTVREGEEYDLTLTAKPPWPNMQLTGSVLLMTGVAEAPQQTIPVAVSIVPRLRTEPRQVIVPGVQTATAERTFPMQVIWDGQPGKILQATVSDPGLTVELAEENKKLVLKVPANFTPRTAGGGVVITLQTDDPIVPALSVPIYITQPPAAGGPAAAARAQVVMPADQGVNAAARAMGPPTTVAPVSAAAASSQPADGSYSPH
jgi:hypothetical protein